MVRPGRPSRTSIFRRLRDEIDEQSTLLGGLPSPRQAIDIWKGIWYEEAHHSTAIEGNTLVLKQVETLLEQGRTVGNKELRDYMEVRGYANAAEWVYQQASKGDWADGSNLTLAELRHIHDLGLGPVWTVEPHPEAGPDEAPGQFRRHDIHPFPGGMVPPTWTDVPAQITDWIAQVNALDPASESFLEDLARIHSGFERIHPFIDGNGRTGRLVLNLVLVRLGFPPIVILKSQKATYLRALRRADQGDSGALAELIARAILSSLHRFVVPAMAQPDQLIPLAALTDQHTKEATLQAAAARGRLRAVKGSDGRWRSTRVWLDDYRASRYQRQAQ